MSGCPRHSRAPVFLAPASNASRGAVGGGKYRWRDSAKKHWSTCIFCVTGTFLICSTTLISWLLARTPASTPAFGADCSDSMMPSVPSSCWGTSLGRSSFPPYRTPGIKLKVSHPSLSSVFNPPDQKRLDWPSGWTVLPPNQLQAALS